MEVNSYLTQKEQIRDYILEYIDKESDNNDESSFTQLKEKIKEKSSKYDLEELLHLILSISNNRHCNPYFFERIKQILFLIKDQIKQNISIPELFELFSTNKRLQLILFELEIISIQDPAIEAFFKRSISNYTFIIKQNASNDTFTDHSRHKKGAMMISPTNTNYKSYQKHENLLCYFYPEIESKKKIKQIVEILDFYQIFCKFRHSQNFV